MKGFPFLLSRGRKERCQTGGALKGPRWGRLFRLEYEYAWGRLSISLILRGIKSNSLKDFQTAREYN